MFVAVQVSSTARQAIAKQSAERDEHQALGIEVELPVEPVVAPFQDVRAILLDSVASLFSA